MVKPKKHASDTPNKKELYFSANVRIRCHIAVATHIRVRLRPGSARSKLFRCTCFGPWLDVKSTSNDACLVHLILQTEYTLDVNQDALFFRVGGQELRFGPQEFCLITGLRFGHDNHNRNQRSVDMTFRERVFGHVDGRPKVSDLENVFDSSLDQLSDLDAVRLCLLMLVEVGFMGRGPNVLVDSISLELVDDLDSWNTFPWGSYVWELVYKQLHNALEKRSGRCTSKPLGYQLTGFIWAFKIWIFEVFPYAKNFAIKYGGIPRAISWGKNRCITWNLALSFITYATLPGFEPIQVLTSTPEECATDWWRASRQFFDGYANDCSPLLKRARLSSPPKPKVMVRDKLVGTVSSPSDIVCVQGYKVKQSVAPILESIFDEHGDIAADCIFKPASMRSSFLEIICEVVSRLQTNDDIDNMEEIEQKVIAAEAANINVSWLRVHLDTIRRKEATRKISLLMEMKVNTGLVKKAALMDLRERCAELVAAQQRFKKAERCVRVLHLVENNLNDNILEHVRSM